MSMNDFMSSKPKENEFLKSSETKAADEFSTIQNMFQTNNYAGSSGIQSSQVTLSGAPVPSEGEFSTLQNMFQTTNYANLSNPSAPVQTNEVKAPAVDLFADNKPAGSFATMQGGAPASGFDFDMGNFGTMQAKNAPPSLDFFESKQAETKPKEGSANLI